MKHIFRTWPALLISAVFAASSCHMLDDNFPEPDDADGDDGVYHLAIQVNASSNFDETATRATRAVTDYDDYLSLDQFNCLLFGNNSADNAGTYYCSAMCGAQYVIDGTYGSMKYKTFYGTIDTIPNPNSGYRFAVLANYYDFRLRDIYLRRLGGVSFQNIIEKYSAFKWPAGQLPSEDHPIPMFGCFGTGSPLKYSFKDGSYQLHYYQKGNSGYDVSFSLLRAMARIYVRSNDALDSVMITRCNTLGCVMPRNYGASSPGFTSVNSSSKASTTWTDADMNIPGETAGSGLVQEVAEDVLFYNMGKSRNYTYNYVLYLPEYRNRTNKDKSNCSGGTSVSPDASTIIPAHLKFKLGGYWEEIPIGDYEGGKYVEGTQTNIVRNYSYEFILTSTRNTPLITYEVLPMDTLVSGNIAFD